MNKQSKQIYSSLMNRIAIAMMINQGVMALLGGILSIISVLLISVWGEGMAHDIAYGIGECAVYMFGFIIPMNIFIKMNKNADGEVYEPIESEKMPKTVAVFAVGFSLGAIILASYLNYFLVNAFGNYSDFTSTNLWSVELEHPYQIIIYLASSVIIPSVVEEYFFRNTICKALTVYGKGTAILASAALFALMHTNAEQIIYAFVGGVLLAWIYVETKSIAIPIIVHMINNGTSAIADIINAHLGEKVASTYITVSDIAILVISLISLVGIIVYVKKKGRLIDKLILKPDENGEAVMPLSVRERISGFFSTGVVIFTIYSLLIMIGLIWLSVIA